MPGVHWSWLRGLHSDAKRALEVDIPCTAFVIIEFWTERGSALFVFSFVGERMGTYIAPPMTQPDTPTSHRDDQRVPVVLLTMIIETSQELSSYTDPFSEYVLS